MDFRENGWDLAKQCEARYDAEPGFPCPEEFRNWVIKRKEKPFFYPQIQDFEIWVSQNEVKGQGFSVKDVKQDVEMASICLKFLEWRGFGDEERRIRKLVEKLVSHYKIVLEE